MADRDPRWIPLGALVAGAVVHLCACMEPTFAIPAPYKVGTFTWLVMPTSWMFARATILLIGVLTLGTVFAMVIGRERRVIPRRVLLVIAVVASAGLVCALVALQQLHAIETVSVEPIAGRDTVPAELTAAPFEAIAGLALAAFGAWRLWWVARVTRVS